MQNIPPHLPKKSCDIKTHQRFKSVWFILFIMFVTALGSFAFTLSTLVWFAPTFIPEQLNISTQKSSKEQREELDTEVLNKTKQRLWYIYDKREKISGKFYANDVAKLQAVLFSSDGWAIVYVPDYKKGLEKYWEAADYQGVSYKIEKVFVDTLSNLAYVKFVHSDKDLARLDSARLAKQAGTGFSFISFANWNEISSGLGVWEVSGNKQQKHNLQKPIKISEEKSYFIWQPQFFYQLGELAEPGNLIINDNGEMVGILDKNRGIIYGWMVDSQFASILQNGVTDYTAVSWKGRMAHGYAKEEDYIKKVSGFYVDSSATRAEDNAVGAGDLIVRIQNRSVEDADLARQILSAPEKFAVTILRDGKELTLDVVKTSILK